MGLSNDERGWVMTGLSGIACVFGAAVICVDILIRQFPGKRNFRIEDSDAFLSSSLSLSFGVMLFSALYSMLPSSKDALQKGGFSAKQASWIMIACFIGGVIGIQILSNFIHRFMPSHVVDCEHTHDDLSSKKDESSSHTAHEHSADTREHESHAHDHHQHGRNENTSHKKHTHRSTKQNCKSLSSQVLQNDHVESRPVSAPSHAVPRGRPRANGRSTNDDAENNLLPASVGRKSRPSIGKRLTSTLSQMAGRTDANCGKDCYGFTHPCSPECFQNINSRTGLRTKSTTRPMVERGQLTRSVTEGTPLLENITERSTTHEPSLVELRNGLAPRQTSEETESPYQSHDDDEGSSISADEAEEPGAPDHHHHHVPTNAFLSIGMQTSIAIALHKLPEGFITYATNHANPKLGVAVFLALFIHNITEGFALALPLYLALHSRTKAMMISFALGGLTQPFGAGIAALWFKVAGKGDWAPSEGVYGAMFAVTAGIMASVALQLFSEALDLTHSRVLCIVGAFSGMTILGISSALTA